MDVTVTAKRAFWYRGLHRRAGERVEMAPLEALALERRKLVSLSKPEPSTGASVRWAMSCHDVPAATATNEEPTEPLAIVNVVETVDCPVPEMPATDDVKPRRRTYRRRDLRAAETIVLTPDDQA
jgi:hypothetical protein